MADQNAAGSDSDVDSDVVPISGEGVPRPPTRNSRIDRSDFDHLVATSHTISGSGNLCCALSLLGPDASTEAIIRLYDDILAKMDILASDDVVGEVAREELRKYKCAHVSHAVLALMACSPAQSVACLLATLTLRRTCRRTAASKQGARS